MADKQITPFQLTDQFTMDNFNQRINETNIALQSKPNPNLLDNWYFVNPVDQRQGRVVKPNTTYYSDNTLTTSAGTTSAYVTAYRYATGTASGVSYASFKLTDSDTAPTYYAAPENVVRGYTGVGYGIDRWAGASGSETFTIENNSVRIYGERGTGYFVQQIDTPSLYAGRTLTASILTADGELITCTGQVLLGVALTIASADIEGKGSLNIYTGGVNLQFHVAVYSGQSISIKAAKLELGSQQTLAHQENGNWVLNEIPDYGEQLARCQRYYYDSRFGRVHESDGAYSATITTSNAYLVGNYRFPVTMRVKPGITIYSCHGTANRISYWSSLADVDKAVEANNLTVGASGFNAVQATTAFDPNIYSFHIVANAEL